MHWTRNTEIIATNMRTEMMTKIEKNITESDILTGEVFSLFQRKNLYVKMKVGVG